MVRTLTLEDRRKTELMWRRNASPVKIAAELEISQRTVYTELKRGQETDGADFIFAVGLRQGGKAQTAGQVQIPGQSPRVQQGADQQHRVRPGGLVGPGDGGVLLRRAAGEVCLLAAGQAELLRRDLTVR